MFFADLCKPPPLNSPFFFANVLGKFLFSFKMPPSRPLPRSQPLQVPLGACDGVGWKGETKKEKRMRKKREVSHLHPSEEKTQEGCGGLGGENAGVFPKAGLLFQQLFSLPESVQTLAGIAIRAARKSGKNFPAVKL